MNTPKRTIQILNDGRSDIHISLVRRLFLCYHHEMDIKIGNLGISTVGNPLYMLRTNIQNLCEALDDKAVCEKYKAEGRPTYQNDIYLNIAQARVEKYTQQTTELLKEHPEILKQFGVEVANSTTSERESLQ